MIRAALLLPLAVLFTGASSRIPRPAAHRALPAAAGPQGRRLPVDSMTSSFTVSGVHIILRRNT